jgi:hypothetical protein
MHARRDDRRTDTIPNTVDRLRRLTTETVAVFDEESACSNPMRVLGPTGVERKGNPRIGFD